jgi:hypothetical protein
LSSKGNGSDWLPGAFAPLATDPTRPLGGPVPEPHGYAANTSARVGVSYTTDHPAHELFGIEGAHEARRD